MGAVLVAALLICASTLGCRGGSSTEQKSATGTAVSAATIAPRPSPGCDAPAPVPGVQIEHLTSNAVDRIYRRFIPPTDVTGPMPLVLNLHGLLSNIDQQVAISGFETMAAPERFIVVTPQGVGTPPGWSFDGTANNPDLTFLNAVLDEVEANACVDTARIYATGLSNGGMMSSLLACYDADRIAAVGLVSGILHPGGCQPSRPMPMLVLWGKQDGILPYCGGVGP